MNSTTIARVQTPIFQPPIIRTGRRGAPTTGRSAAHVGRVGGLAVALGVGAAVWAMPALAAADTAPGASSSSSSTRGSDAGSATHVSGPRSRAGVARSPGRRGEVVRPVTLGGARNRSSSGHLSRRRHRN